MGLNWQFYHWHLEPSSKCALRCPRCPRVEHPDTPWLNKDMTLDFVKKFFTEDMLRNHVKRVTMCGDVGDPIYCKEYLDICRYIKSVNPKIHLFTITNGSYKKPNWWAEFATILNEYDTVSFSVDGFDQLSNSLYRVNSDFESIVNGIKTLRLHNNNVFIYWASIVFAFNQDKLEDIKQLSASLGCDALQLTKSTKFGSKYGNYGGKNDVLEPRAEFISSSHRYERELISLNTRKQDITDYININTQKFIEIKSQYANAPVVPLCEIGNRGIYVNAEGIVFPCSWTSFPYLSLSHNNKTINWHDSFFSKHRDSMNLHNRSLKDIITDPLWNACSSGFTNHSKTWVECSLKCNQQVVDAEYAVGFLTN